MSALARITNVEYLNDLTLRLTFTDGLVRELDFRPMLGEGVLTALADTSLFCQVRVDEVAGTISWPNGVDLDPDVLHGDYQPEHLSAPTVLAEYRLRSTA